MANYANAKATIAANIYTNHLGQVTAEMVKTAADAIVDTLIAGGYLYAGVAKLTPTQTNPGSPDANVFYIATEPGTYTNFVGAGGSLVVADGEVAILKWNGTWSKEVTGAATAAQVTELGQETQKTQEALGAMVGTYSHDVIHPQWGNVVLGYYWNLVDGVAGLVASSGYRARPELLQIGSGGTLKITVADADNPTGAAFGAYTDTLAGAYNGSARRNFESADDVIQNGDGTSTYVFILPANVSYLGLFYKTNVWGVEIEWPAEYAYSEELDNHIEDVTDNGNLAQTVSKMVGTYTPQSTTPLPWGDVVSGKFWNLVDGVAGLVASSGYFARSELLPVAAGSRLIVTVKNSIITNTGTAAYSVYDNDGVPPSGSSARRNYNSAESIVDNGDGTSTYTFVIESGTTQIGLYYRLKEVTFYLEEDEKLQYSEEFDEHVANVAGGGATTSGDSAKYYLKGASPKSFSSEKKICILAAGQSNIDGRVPYADMPADIQAAQPIANCHYVKNSESGAFSPLNITGKWAFDLVTYYNIAIAQELYVIKWSQGGTSIDPLGTGANHWTADYEKLASESNSLLLSFENEIRNHIASNGENFDIRAMLWHQGEGDYAGAGAGVPDRYYTNLRNMISYVRGIVGNERLPIITGTISEHSHQYDATVHAAQVRLASEDPYFILIDMSGAPLLDNYHFNAASSIYLGEMAYNALIDLGVISGEKLTPTRPW